MTACADTPDEDKHEGQQWSGPQCGEAEGQWVACACVTGVLGTRRCGISAACQCGPAWRDPWFVKAAGAAPHDGDDGAALAKAVQEYVPTPQERKLLAVYWIFLAQAQKTGTVDPAFLASGIPQAVWELSKRWPSQFAAGSTGSATGGLITTASDHACGKSCMPSTDALSSTAGEVWRRGVEATTKGTAWGGISTLYYTVKDVASSVSATKGGLLDAIDAAISQKDADGVLELVGNAITSAGAIAGAATLLGASSPALATIAAVGGAVGAVMTGVEIGRELGNAYDLVQGCFSYEEESCAGTDDPEAPPEPAEASPRGGGESGWDFGATPGGGGGGGSFTCTDGTHVPSQNVCNGQMNCPGGEDDAASMCGVPELCCTATAGCPQETGHNCAQTWCPQRRAARFLEMDAARRRRSAACVGLYSIRSLR